MNHDHHDHHDHDRLTRRLTDHLHDAASAVPLRPGSELGVVRLARRRAARRRQLTAAASVVAVGGVTAVGLQQLSGGPGAEIRMGTETPVGESTPENVTAPTAPTAPPPDAVPPAEFVEPSLVWRAIRPDAAEAVGGSMWGRQTEFPGVLLSTAPGRREEWVPQLWRSDDGVTFTPTGAPPGAQVRSSSLIGRGDRLYAFGTAPGMAADAENPLLASISADGGDTWDEVTLPVDAHLGATAADIISRSTTVNGASIAADGSVLLLVNQSLHLDVEAYGLTDFVDQTRDGIVVPTSECVAPATTMPHADVTTTTVYDDPESAERAASMARYGCETALRTWEELGVPADTAAALRAPRHRLLFAADGTTFTEIDLPAGDAAGIVLPSDRHHFVASYGADASATLHRLASDATWQPLPAPPGSTGPIVEFGETFVMLDGMASAPGELVVSTLGDDGEWSPVDLAGDSTKFQYFQHLAAGQSGVMATAYVDPSDPYAIGSDEGMVTTTSIEAASAGPPATTEEAPVPTMVDDGAFGPPEWNVFHSVDGVRWSKESIAELAGVPAERISTVTRVSTAGDTFVVTVTLREVDAETVPEQVVLVGTPAG